MTANLTREQLLEALEYVLSTGGLPQYRMDRISKVYEVYVAHPGCGCCSGGDFETPAPIIQTLRTIYESLDANNSKDS